MYQEAKTLLAAMATIIAYGFAYPWLVMTWWQNVAAASAVGLIGLLIVIPLSLYLWGRVFRAPLL